GLKAVREALPRPLSPVRQAQYEAALAEWKQKGVPSALAAQLASMPMLEFAPDIIEIALERKVPPADVSQAFFAVGAALQLPWVCAQVSRLPVDGRWHAPARRSPLARLAARQRSVVS